MRSAFLTIFIKEMKSIIRDPKILITMIIVPVVLTGLMYGIMGAMTTQAVKQAMKPGGEILLVDLDHGYWAENFTNYLTSNKYAVIKYNDIDTAIKNYNNALCILVIPKGFSKNLTRGYTAYLQVYYRIRGISFTSMMMGYKVYGIIRQYSDMLSKQILERAGLSPEYVSSPINSTSNIVIGNIIIKNIDPSQVTGPLLMLGLFVPLIIGLLAGFVAQLSATSIAVEKEQKMLETLLTLPLSRFSLIAAKVTAAFIVSLIGGGAYFAIMAWYFSQMSSLSATNNSASSSIALSALIKAVGMQTPAVLVIAGFGTLFLALGIALLLAMFVDDVRSAQIISGYIIAPLMLSIFIGLFLDITTMSPVQQTAIAAIPFANLVFILNLGLTGNYIAQLVAAFSSWTYAIIVLYIASKIIGTEKIFTMKLFKRKRRTSLGFHLLTR